MHNKLDELDPRLLGLATNLESQVACDSAARSAMRSSFLMQMLVLSGATPRRIVTLAEREYAKYTMKIEVPCDAKVIKILRKYPKYRGEYNFKKNSEITIIYESMNDGVVGHLTIPNFHWNHKVFGFQYKLNRLLKNLSEGDYLRKGEILACSPSVTEDFDYYYGIESRMAYMTVPGIIEDGVVVSKSYCQKLRTKGYGSKVLEWGVDCFPLNLYGNDDNYKVVPDIGDEVREDGILFATRDYDPILAICDMTIEATQNVDHTYDKITYIPLSSVSPDEMPTIEDITVWHTHNKDLHKTPVQMEEQITKYHETGKDYNSNIYRAFQQLQRERGKHLVTTNEFHALTVRAYINDNHDEISKDDAGKKMTKSLSRTFRKNKLDDWRLEIKYSWDITPDIGYKLTGLHG